VTAASGTAFRGGFEVSDGKGGAVCNGATLTAGNGSVVSLSSGRLPEGKRFTAELRCHQRVYRGEVAATQQAQDRQIRREGTADPPRAPPSAQPGFSRPGTPVTLSVKPLGRRLCGREPTRDAGSGYL